MAFSPVFRVAIPWFVARHKCALSSAILQSYFGGAKVDAARLRQQLFIALANARRNLLL